MNHKIIRNMISWLREDSKPQTLHIEFHTFHTCQLTRTLRTICETILFWRTGDVSGIFDRIKPRKEKKGSREWVKWGKIEFFSFSSFLLFSSFIMNVTRKKNKLKKSSKKKRKEKSVELVYFVLFSLLYLFKIESTVTLVIASVKKRGGKVVVFRTQNIEKRHSNERFESHQKWEKRSQEWHEVKWVKMKWRQETAPK